MRKTSRLVIVLVAILWCGLVYAEVPSTKEFTADELVAKANHMALYQGDDSKGKVRMVITDKQGRKRIREFNMLRKDNNDQDDSDQKYFVFFNKPADVRKMIFMVHKHVGPNKDDDRWLYMPSLDLVKRIAASDKRTSFVGSDFLYEDISGRSPKDDEHKLLEVNDDYFVIKNIPKKPDEVEFVYYLVYLHKKYYLPVRIEYFKKGGRLYRVIESDQIKEIEAESDGKKVVYPTVIKSSARDVDSGSVTQMIFSNIKFNIGLEDDIFTERYLRRPPRDAMR